MTATWTAPILVLLFAVTGCSSEFGAQYLHSLQQYGCARSGDPNECKRTAPPNGQKVGALPAPSGEQDQVPEIGETLA
jgi:hypothetical protein